MPIHEYQCPECGQVFEYITTSYLHNEERLPCKKPGCRGMAERRVPLVAPQKTPWPLKKRRMPDYIKPFN